MNHAVISTVDATDLDVMSDPRVLFPHSGSNAAVNQRRIAVLCDVHGIASNILSWGTGATTVKTLRATIDYYGNFRCSTSERIMAVHDYIASFVPGGLDADLSEFGRDYLRDLMGECAATARGQEARVRKMMRGVAA